MVAEVLPKLDPARVSTGAGRGSLVGGVHGIVKAL
jgi:hypothetical protein